VQPLVELSDCITRAVLDGCSGRCFRADGDQNDSDSRRRVVVRQPGARTKGGRISCRSTSTARWPQYGLPGSRSAPAVWPLDARGSPRVRCTLSRRHERARRSSFFAGSQVPQTRHCKHCWGDCPGDCLLPGEQGLCIHIISLGPPLRYWPRLMLTRRFWRWFLMRQ